MKKKLALLLAVVMLIGIALPTNVAASTNNTRRGNAMRYYDAGTVMVDLRVGQEVFSGVSGNSGLLSEDAMDAVYDSLLYSKFGVEPYDFLANDGTGIDFTMQVRDITDKSGTLSSIANTGYYEFEARLSNAYWAHIKTDPDDAILTNNGSKTGQKNTYGEYLVPANVRVQSNDFVPYNVDVADGWITSLVTTGKLEWENDVPASGNDMLADDYKGTLPHPQKVVEDAIKAGLTAVQTQLTSWDTWKGLSEHTPNDLFEAYNSAALKSINTNWDYYKRNVADLDRTHAKEVELLLKAAVRVYEEIYAEALPPTATNHDCYSSYSLATVFNITAPTTANATITTLASYKNEVAEYPLSIQDISDAINAGKWVETYDPLLVSSDLISFYDDVATKSEYAAVRTALGMTANDGLNVSDDHGLWYFYTASGYLTDTELELFAYQVGGTGSYGLSQTAFNSTPTDLNTLTLISDFKKIKNVVEKANAYVGSLGALAGANYTNMKNFFSTTHADGMNEDFFTEWTAAERNDFIINKPAKARPGEFDYGLYQFRIDNSVGYNNLFYTTGTTGSTGGAVNDGTYANGVTNYAMELSDGRGKAIPYWIEVQTKDPSVAIIRVSYNDLAAITLYDVLLLPMDIITLDPEEEVTLTIHSVSNLFTSGVYNIGTAGASVGTTKAAFKTIVNAAKGRIYLGVLRIDEVTPNTLKNGRFVLIPPAGYNMVDNGIEASSSTTFSYIFGSSARVKFNGYATINDGSGDRRNCMVLEFTGMPNSRQSAGYVEIGGLSMTPLDNNPELISNYGDKLNVIIRDANRSSYWTNYSSTYNFLGWCSYYGFTITYPAGTDLITNQANANIYPQTMEAAYREYWNIDYFGADPVTKFSGLVDQATAKVTVKELVLDSWATEKDTYFTVCDADGNELSDVKITRVGIKQNNLRAVGNDTRGFANLLTDSSMTYKYNYDINREKTAGQYQWLNCAFSVGGHQFVVSDLYKYANSSYRTMELTFYLSAQANFEGDVYIKMSGSSIADNIYDEVSNNSIVQVATFVPPVVITTQPTEVQIGWQKYALADVSITENMISGVGSIQNGKKLQIALGEYGSGRLTTYMYFAPLAKGDVTLGSDPNFNISEVIQSSWINNSNSYGYSQRVIEFTVLRKSKNVAGEINITNLNLNIDRQPPQGSYDLLVGGNAIVDNNLPYDKAYTFMYDRFDVWGVVQPEYIVIKTEGSNTQTKNKVELTAGTNIIRVNGVEQEMEVAALMVDDRFYVPLRFAAVALNVPDENISFDDGSRKALIITPERTVAFQQNSSNYWINGIELSMLEGGVEAIAFIENDRMYIPVRFLAYGLNVQVDYDPETHVAILNSEK